MLHKKEVHKPVKPEQTASDAHAELLAELKRIHALLLRIVPGGE